MDSHLIACNARGYNMAGDSIEYWLNLDLKGNEKLDKLKASLSDVKESVEIMIIGIKSKKTSAFPFSSPKKT